MARPTMRGAMERGHLFCLSPGERHVETVVRPCGVRGGEVRGMVVVLGLDCDGGGAGPASYILPSLMSG